MGGAVSEYFASRPFVVEFVFLGPEFMRGGSSKEVCDLIITHRKQALLVQMKCQEDPDSRSGSELTDFELGRRDSNPDKQIQSPFQDKPKSTETLNTDAGSSPS
jgi:hypothetical protein